MFTEQSFRRDILKDLLLWKSQIYPYLHIYDVGILFLPSTSKTLTHSSLWKEEIYRKPKQDHRAFLVILIGFAHFVIHHKHFPMSLDVRLKYEHTMYWNTLILTILIFEHLGWFQICYYKLHFDSLENMLIHKSVCMPFFEIYFLKWWSK